MKIALPVLLIFLVVASCKKSSVRENNNSCPPELVGRWVRGEFNMSEFEQYNGMNIMSPSYTTGALDFRADGTIYNYSVYFPTDPKGGCNPQVLTVYSGAGDYSSSGKMTMEFDSGTERKFYQQCPGKTNLQRVLEANDLSGVITVFWSVEIMNGKKVLAISYDNPGNPKILLEKKNW